MLVSAVVLSLLATQPALPGEDVDDSPSLAEVDFSFGLLDTHARGRFELATKMLPGEFGTTWTFDGGAQFKVAEGTSLQFQVPVAFVNPAPGYGSETPFLGNVRAGVGFGRALRLAGNERVQDAPTVNLAFGVDAYFPTQPDLRQTRQPTLVNTDAPCSLRSPCDLGADALTLRADDPGSWMSQTFAGRLRGAIGFTSGPVALTGELGVVPGLELNGNKDPIIWVSYAARARFGATSWLDLFIEGRGSTRVLNDDDARHPDGPFSIRPGVRFRTDQLSVGLFAGILVGGDDRFFLGLDLTGLEGKPTREDGQFDGPVQF